MAQQRPYPITLDERRLATPTSSFVRVIMGVGFGAAPAQTAIRTYQLKCADSGRSLRPTEWVKSTYLSRSLPRDQVRL